PVHVGDHVSGNGQPEHLVPDARGTGRKLRGYGVSGILHGPVGTIVSQTSAPDLFRYTVSQRTLPRKERSWRSRQPPTDHSLSKPTSAISRRCSPSTSQIRPKPGISPASASNANLPPARRTIFGTFSSFRTPRSTPGSPRNRPDRRPTRPSRSIAGHTFPAPLTRAPAPRKATTPTPSPPATLTATNPCRRSIPP